MRILCVLVLSVGLAHATSCGSQSTVSPSQFKDDFGLADQVFTQENLQAVPRDRLIKHTLALYDAYHLSQVALTGEKKTVPLFYADGIHRADRNEIISAALSLHFLFNRNLERINYQAEINNFSQLAAMAIRTQRVAEEREERERQEAARVRQQEKLDRLRRYEQAERERIARAQAERRRERQALEEEQRREEEARRLADAARRRREQAERQRREDLDRLGFVHGAGKYRWGTVRRDFPELVQVERMKDGVVMYGAVDADVLGDIKIAGSEPRVVIVGFRGDRLARIICEFDLSRWDHVKGELDRLLKEDSRGEPTEPMWQHQADGQTISVTSMILKSRNRFTLTIEPQR